MRRTVYFKRASRRFLEGTCFKSPAEAVEAGNRSLELWTRMLEEEREIDEDDQRERWLSSTRPFQSARKNLEGVMC
jgi:hypothetical protein